MSFHDDHGLACTGADADSAAHYRRALHQFRCYIEDPVASVDAALALRPDFVMAHALKAWLHLLGTEPAGIPVATLAIGKAGAKRIRYVDHFGSSGQAVLESACRMDLEGVISKKLDAGVETEKFPKHGCFSRTKT